MNREYELNEIYGEPYAGVGTADYDTESMMDAAADLEADGHGYESPLPHTMLGVEDLRGLETNLSRTHTPTPAPESAASTSKAKPKTKKPAAVKPKPKAKPKATRPSTKAAPKARVAQLKAGTGTSSRGRSISETPALSTSEHGTPTPIDTHIMEDDGDYVEDTKLYCMCQTLYDEEKMMIACDRCDEWFHPPCVHLSDAQVELVDTFFCPRCAAVDPSLVTSYKPVCARPDCTHPGRPPLSKYCSEDCGIRAVMARVDAWNGDTDQLMEHPAVANAKPLEGLLIKPLERTPSPTFSSSHEKAIKLKSRRRQQPRDNDEIRRQLAQINEEIQRISADRDLRERLRQAVEARLQLLARASDRRRSFGEGALCCFDSRLVLDEDAWEDWLNDGGWESMHQDEIEEEGPWYCTNKKKCDRHHGWEELKAADFELEDKVLGQRLSEMSARERVLRLQMENLQTLLQARETTAALRAQNLAQAAKVEATA